MEQHVLQYVSVWNRYQLHLPATPMCHTFGTRYHSRCPVYIKRHPSNAKKKPHSVWACVLRSAEMKRFVHWEKKCCMCISVTTLTWNYRCMIDTVPLWFPILFLIWRWYIRARAVLDMILIFRRQKFSEYYPLGHDFVTLIGNLVNTCIPKKCDGWE